MTAYWIVWISILILSLLVQGCDYLYPNIMTKGRVYHSRSARFFYAIASALLVFVAGCRFYVGTDFGSYYKGYKGFCGDLFKHLIELNEPGIRAVYTIAVTFKDDPAYCIFLVAAVTLILELVTLYKNTDRIAMALLLFTTMVWSSCFNGIKQALAVAVLFCGYPALRDKKFMQYALFVFLAFLCHRSAIVMILIYFIAHRDVNIKNVVIIIVASVVVLLSFNQVIQVTGWVMDMDDVSNLTTYWTNSVNILRVVTRIAPAVFFLVVYSKREKPPTTSYYLYLLIIHAVIGITTANSTCLARMSMYSAPFALIAIVELQKQLGKHRQLVCTLIVLLYWIMAFYELVKGDSPTVWTWVWQR